MINLIMVALLAQVAHGVTRCNTGRGIVYKLLVVKDASRQKPQIFAVPSRLSVS